MLFNSANAKAYMLACLLACFASQSRIASATMSCCDHGAVRSSFRETATLMSSFTRSAGNLWEKPFTPSTPFLMTPNSGESIGLAALRIIAVDRALTSKLT